MSELQRAQEAALAAEPGTPAYEEAMMALMWARLRAEDEVAESGRGVAELMGPV